MNPIELKNSKIGFAGIDFHTVKELTDYLNQPFFKTAKILTETIRQSSGRYYNTYTFFYEIQ